MSEYIFVDKTQQLIRGFFAVQNDVGLGRNEEAYQRAFEIWTSEERLPIVSKPPVQLLIQDRVAHTLYPDFLGWDEIVVKPTISGGAYQTYRFHTADAFDAATIR